jgi:peptidoglycan-associated lipoprotein
MDIIPNGGDLGGFAIDGSALDGSLQARGPSDGIGGGMYNGRQMVEGQLQSIYFGFDASSISTAERAKLQQAADHLRDNPSDGLLIEGHCDWYGTADYNIALGERRAKSARDYVTTLGINPMRVETLSKGSLEAVTGGSKHESAEDRRADLIILK